MRRPETILSYGDKVRFTYPETEVFPETTYEGQIFIVDRDGGGQYFRECTSYDIMVPSIDKPECLHKHVPFNIVTKL